MEDITKIIQEIQYMIVPGVMISSSALFLLGFQTKFSNLAARFRTLNQEKRQLSLSETRSEAEAIRLGNLTEQVEQIMKRADCVKNAILFTYGGILLFIATSILIFFKVFIFPFSHYLAVVVFLTGFLCLAAASVFMIIETNIFYKVIALEKSFKNRRLNR